MPPTRTSRTNREQTSSSTVNTSTNRVPGSSENLDARCDADCDPLVTRIAGKIVRSWHTPRERQAMVVGVMARQSANTGGQLGREVARQSIAAEKRSAVARQDEAQQEDHEIGDTEEEHEEEEEAERSLNTPDPPQSVPAARNATNNQRKYTPRASRAYSPYPVANFPYEPRPLRRPRRSEATKLSSDVAANANTHQDSHNPSEESSNGRNATHSRDKELFPRRARPSELVPDPLRDKADASLGSAPKNEGTELFPGRGRASEFLPPGQSWSNTIEDHYSDWE